MQACWRYTVTCCIVLGTTHATVNDEDRLLTYLRSVSDPRSRPVVQSSNAVIARVNLWLTGIEQVHEHRGFITISAWVHRYWTDELHVWVPAAFGGVTEINIDHIWRPQITMVHSVLRPWDKNVEVDDVEIKSSGYAYDSRPAALSPLCEFDFSRFPFDTQTCRIEFESWEYHGGRMDLQLANASLDGMGPVEIDPAFFSVEWQLLDEIETYRTVAEYPSANGVLQYPRLYWTFRLRRKPKM